VLDTPHSRERSGYQAFSLVMADWRDPPNASLV
jgi:hypothetical protein